MIDLKVLKKLSNISVLLVEDDEMISHAIQQSLSAYCKEVYIAYDGMQGYEMFELKKPDIIISDINLPQMNGLEMIESIHAVSPHLPVIIITSYDTSENILASLNQGAYAYLRKPLHMEDLQTSLLLAANKIYGSKIILEYGFEYDSENKILKNTESESVTLTRYERDLLHLLITNHNKVVNYMTIESYVWQDKNMSPETLRMCIKKIRNKTYPDIIKNVLGLGYQIDLK